MTTVMTTLTTNNDNETILTMRTIMTTTMIPRTTSTMPVGVDSDDNYNYNNDDNNYNYNTCYHN